MEQNKLELISGDIEWPTICGIPLGGKNAEFANYHKKYRTQDPLVHTYRLTWHTDWRNLVNPIKSIIYQM